MIECLARFLFREGGDLFATLVGALIGLAGAFLGVYLTEYLQKKRELQQFYSWIAALLDRLLNADQKELSEEKMREDVTRELNYPSLHYLFNKLWMRIPETDGALVIRDTMLKFLKSGDELEKKIELDKEIKKKYLNLLKWLKQRNA